MSDDLGTTPVPLELRTSIRKTAEFLDSTNNKYVLTDPDIGWSLQTDLVSFWEENCDQLPANVFYRIFSLSKGECIVFGGGAAASITLRREV